MNNKLWIAVAVAVLTACGGGGDGGWSSQVPSVAGSGQSSENVPVTPAPEPGKEANPDSNRNPVPETTPTPSARSFRYQWGDSAALTLSPLAEFQAEGAKGWRYLSGVIFSSDDATTPYASTSLFVSDGRTSYSYESTAPANTMAALQKQLNDYGARGFRFTSGSYLDDTSGALRIQALFRKENGSTETYGYRLFSQNPRVTVADRLAELKAQGAEGYRYDGDHFILSSEVVSPSGCCEVVDVAQVYRKESQSQATFDYAVLAVPPDDAGMLSQLTAQGARGFRLIKPVFFVIRDRVELRNLYEKDMSQSAVFSYRVLPWADSPAAFLAQANAQGAAGLTWEGDYWFGDVVWTLYVKASACNGSDCEFPRIFGF